MCIRDSSIILGSNRVVDMKSITNYLIKLEDAVTQKKSTHLYYEDLVSTPELALKSICNFLEIQFEESMLTPTQLDDFDKLIKRNNPKDTPFITELYGKQISSQNIDKWTENLTYIEKLLVNRSISKAKILTRHIHKYNIKSTNALLDVILYFYINLNLLWHNIKLVRMKVRRKQL